MKDIVVIGYGALGKILTSAIVARLNKEYRLVGVYDLALDEGWVDVEGERIKSFGSFDQVLASSAELVVEIASVAAVREVVLPLLEGGKDVVIVSVGALADDDLFAAIRKTAKAHGRKVHLTSGAVGGFDLLQTLGFMGGAVTKIQSTKAPKSLNGAPYLKGQNLPEDESQVAFEGGAREAIAGFPKNTNVSVATGLASGGLEVVQVQVVSDPEAEGNTHKISIENDRAKATVEVTAKTDPQNPRSSVTAAWSVAALLHNLADPIQFY